MADDIDEILQELDEALDAMLQENAAPKTDQEIVDAFASLQFRVIYQSNNFFLPQLHNLISEREVLNIRPEYQRRLRWSPTKKSQLIESLLLNVPIPPIFLFESEHARYEVMDGQQRLNAVHEFLSNEYALIGLEKLSFLNGRRYTKLPPQVRRGLERSSMSATVLLRESMTGPDPYLVRRFVFERLNTGGEKLNQQEIRNSLYKSPFNNLLVELSRNQDFCFAFEIPPYGSLDSDAEYENPARKRNKLYQTMGDCQLVLRFFTLLEPERISGSMSKMMDRCMERFLNVNEQDLDRQRELFSAVLEASVRVFGFETFRLPPDKKGRRRVSAALYDAITVSFARRASELGAIVNKKEDVKVAIDSLVAERLSLFTGQANTAASIRERQNSVGAILDLMIAA